MNTNSWTPDHNAAGLAKADLDPLRYEGHTDDPCEVAGIIQRLLPSKVRILDIGCGTGSLTLIANRDKDNDVVGLEPDAERAAAAADRGLSVVNSELTADFLTEHGPFDAIILADVIEHLPSPTAMVALAASGLKPNGLLFVSVPTVAHWSVRLNLLFGRFDYEEVGIMDATHLRWFTRRTLQEFLEHCGLEVVAMTQSAGVTLPIYYRSVFRLIPQRLREFAIRGLARLLPTLFGCQHVVMARKH